jgi:hypothetical protein
MRLKQYITEQINIDTLNDNIHKKCGYYLNLIKGLNPLYRGMDDKPDIGMTVKHTRPRKPLAMGLESANVFNKWLRDNGHVPRDIATFLTSNEKMVDTFGKPYYIFPIGKFDYTYVKSRDINYSHGNKWDDEWVDDYYNAISTGDTTKIKEIERLFNKSIVTNRNFREAYKKKYEIWIYADYYYCITTKYMWDKDNQVIIKRNPFASFTRTIVDIIDRDLLS